MIRSSFVAGPVGALALLLCLAAPLAAQDGGLAMHGAAADNSLLMPLMESLEAVDLDGDGLTDLIGSDGQFASLWRQVEGGRLTPIFPDGAKPGGRVVAADLDGDGALSLVSVRNTSITTREFVAPFVLGESSNLGPGLTLNKGLLLVADLDGDGHDDLLAATGPESGSLLAFLGDGVGGLQPGFTAFGSGSRRSAVGDLDGDGTLDTLAVNAAGATPLLGQGDGTFQALPVLPGTALARCADLGHLNSDGLLDAAVHLLAEARLEMGVGTGSFTAGAVIASEVKFSFNPALRFADTDRDGDSDLLMADLQGVTVHVLQDGQPVASGRFGVAAAMAADAAFLELGGTACVAALNGGSSSATDVTIAQCGTDGLPLLEQRFPTVDGEPVALADVDGDGRDDLVVLQHPPLHPWQLVVHQVPGDGSFGPAGPGTPVPAEVYQAGVLVADLDGDTLQDLVVIDGAGLPDQELAPFRSNGDGSFTPGTPAVPTFVNGSISAIGDLDGDGDDDVLFKAHNATDLAWHASGPGGFGPAQPVVIPQGPPKWTPMLLADSDHDGLDDLFSTSAAGGSLVRWKALGNGSFAAPEVLAPLSQSLIRLLAHDLDGDGEIDLVATIPDAALGTYTDVMVLHGIGGGNFGVPATYAAGIQANEPLAAVDLEGDGRAELLVPNFYPGRLRLLSQAADGSFGGPRGVAFQGVPLAIDVDGDGVKDLLGSGELATNAWPLRVGWMHDEPGPLDMGLETVGSVGKPVLTGGGTLRPTELAFMKLQAAPASTPLLLVIGLETAYAPFGGSALTVFGGGTLVPQPQLVLGGLVSDAGGSLSLEARWPADAPVGLTVFVQACFKDPLWGWPVASNALQFEGD